jgi:hypothetical protein
MDGGSGGVQCPGGETPAFWCGRGTDIFTAEDAEGAEELGVGGFGG